MTFWTTPQFKALQKDWYQRLEQEGFKDAEELIGGDLKLKQSAGYPYRDQHPMTREVKEEYFRVLAQMVQESKFRNETDRFILMAHSEGKKAKTICEELQALGVMRFRHSIRFTVRRYEKLWGLRHYTPRQLGRKIY